MALMVVGVLCLVSASGGVPASGEDSQGQGRLGGWGQSRGGWEGLESLPESLFPWIFPDHAAYFAPENVADVTGKPRDVKVTKAASLNSKTGIGSSEDQGSAPASSGPASNGLVLQSGAGDPETSPSLGSQSAHSTPSASAQRSGASTGTSSGKDFQEDSVVGTKVPPGAQRLNEIESSPHAGSDKPHSRHRRFLFSMLDNWFDKEKRYNDNWDLYNRPMSITGRRRRNRNRTNSYPIWGGGKRFTGVFGPRFPIVPGPTPRATPPAFSKPYSVLTPTYPFIGIQSDKWIWPAGDITGALPNPKPAVTSVLG